MTRKEYNQCVELYADGLYRFLVKNLRDSEKARDLVQETFAKVWVKSSDIQMEKSKSYLFTTAYHAMVDSIRRDERMVRLDDKHRSRQMAFNSYSDLNEVLSEALQGLPEIQRTVVLLRDYEGYDYREIGEITGLSESQVKVYIFRARTALKNYIQKLELVLEDQ
ncbi:RNA polymerase sigma factor [Bacteroidales bacterium]